MDFVTHVSGRRSDTRCTPSPMTEGGGPPAPSRKEGKNSIIPTAWAARAEGSTDELGAEFTYQYENLHKSTQKITELVPGKKVVWHVTEAEINFVEDKSEWKGTDIVFDIAEKDGKTEVRFTHVGLVPAIECYDSCSDAWGYYVKSSLREFIANGKA